MLWRDLGALQAGSKCRYFALGVHCSAAPLAVLFLRVLFLLRFVIAVPDMVRVRPQEISLGILVYSSLALYPETPSEPN